MSGLGKNMCMDFNVQQNKLNLWEYKQSNNQKFRMQLDNDRIIIFSCANNMPL